MNSQTTRRDWLQLLGGAALGAAALGLTGAARAQEGAGAMGAAAEAGDSPAMLKPLGDYVKPPLPYAFDALEPHIDAETMELHSEKHHAGYTKNFNAALRALAAARAAGDFAHVRELSLEVSFNAGGYFNHILFFNNMTPKKTEPKGALLKALERDFGSLDNFNAHFTSAAKAVQGSGWGVLGMETLQGRLLVLQMENQQNQMVPGIIPLLLCDVWEHAYYKKYGNRRGDYVQAFMNVVNWDFVALHYEAASKITHS